MKKISFDYNNQEWDRYSAFHTNLQSGLFTHFATGEFMCKVTNPRPDQRRVYADYGVALTASIDGKYDFFSPAGLPIKTAWLNAHGAQYYLIDLTSMRAVTLGHTLSTYNTRRCPQNLRYSAAYFLAHDAMPASDIPCSYAYPDKSPATHKWLSDFKVLVNARLILDDVTWKPWMAKPNIITAVMREKEPYELVEQLITTKLLHFWREPQAELITNSCDYFIVKPR